MDRLDATVVIELSVEDGTVVFAADDERDDFAAEPRGAIRRCSETAEFWRSAP
jgi:hypothetical protein